MSEPVRDSRATDQPAASDSAPEKPTAERFVGITNELFKLYANQEYIFVAIDFEKACDWSDPQRRLSECGIAAFDARDVVNKDPGDRGINWQNAIQGIHLRTIEVPHLSPESGQRHPDWCKGPSASKAFLFGKSQWINLANYGTRIRQIIGNLQKKGLTDEQWAAGERRKLVSICFASALERQIDRDLGLGIWDAIPTHWDLQLHPDFGGKLKLKAGITKSQISFDNDLIKRLGLAITNTHNGGNDAFGELHGLLAMATMTEKQWDLAAAGDATAGPAAADSAPAAPAANDPAATGPAVTNPAATNPTAIDPAAVDPAATDSAAPDPAAPDSAAIKSSATAPAAAKTLSYMHPTWIPGRVFSYDRPPSQLTSTGRDRGANRGGQSSGQARGSGPNTGAGQGRGGTPSSASGQFQAQVQTPSQWPALGPTPGPSQNIGQSQYPGPVPGFQAFGQNSFRGQSQGPGQVVPTGPSHNFGQYQGRGQGGYQTPGGQNQGQRLGPMPGSGQAPSVTQRGGFHQRGGSRGQGRNNNQGGSNNQGRGNGRGWNYNA